MYTLSMEGTVGVGSPEEVMSHLLRPCGRGPTEQKSGLGKEQKAIGLPIRVTDRSIYNILLY